MILWAVIIVVEVIKIDITGLGVIVPIVEGEARAAVIGPAEFETIPDRGESRSIQAVGKGATCLVIDDQFQPDILSSQRRADCYFFVI